MYTQVLSILSCNVIQCGAMSKDFSVNKKTLFTIPAISALALEWVNGIEAMSRGISGGKQVIKCASTGNRGRVCLFSRNVRTIGFTLLLHAVKTSR